MARPRIPDKQLPRTTTLPRGSQQNASPFSCRVCARRIRNLPAGADNGLVAGSSPPSSTTQSCANPEFPVSAEHPRFSPVWGGCHGPFALSAGNEDRPEAEWGPSSLTFRSPFPGPRRRPGQRLGSHATETSFRQEIRDDPAALPWIIRLMPHGLLFPRGDHRDPPHPPPRLPGMRPARDSTAWIDC
jgi:hypothetical protein